MARERHSPNTKSVLRFINDAHDVPCPEKCTKRTSPDFSNILYIIMEYLPPGDLARASCVNKFFMSTGTSNGLWSKHVEALFHDKSYVPSAFQDLRRGGDSYRAYWLSLRDSMRQHLTDEELISFEWSRRMKLTSGEHWIETDPYWQGREPNRSRYTADGRLEFIQTEGFSHPLADEDGEDFPTMVVHRHANWGFVMQNCWAVAASFPLPPPGDDPSMDDEALEVTVGAQDDEAIRYNLGLPIGDDGGDEAGGGEGGARGLLGDFLRFLQGNARGGRGRREGGEAEEGEEGGEGAEEGIGFRVRERRAGRELRKG